MFRLINQILVRSTIEYGYYTETNFLLSEQNFLVNKIWLIITIILVDRTKYFNQSSQILWLIKKSVFDQANIN